MYSRDEEHEEEVQDIVEVRAPWLIWFWAFSPILISQP